MRLDVDDKYHKSLAVTNPTDSVTGTLHLFSLEGASKTATSDATLAALPTLRACVADVIVDRRVLDLAKGKRAGADLDTCAVKRTVLVEVPVTLSVDLATPYVPTHNNDSCMLPLRSRGARDDSVGRRFGLRAGTRQEFDSLPEPLTQG